MSRASGWKLSGRVSLWRYTENDRNYPGWNINADLTGCESLLELLDALISDGQGSRSIHLTPPTPAQLQVPANQGGTAAWVAPAKLRVSLSDVASDWRFPQDQNPASLMFGSEWVAPLREGLVGMSAGRGDFSIGKTSIDSLGLWFWWSPSHPHPGLVDG